MNRIGKAELKDMLNRSQNPLFLYDNDADGLCAFLLASKSLGRGKGVAIRSYPGLDKSYVSRAREYNSDCIFVLDKPVLTEEFIESVADMSLPLIWIDHHDMPEPKYQYENFFCYNSYYSKEPKPTSAIIYDLIGRKDDVWIAVAGCIADHNLPIFVEDFKKKYLEFWVKGIKKPFDAYYGSEIGKIAQGLNIGLKDSTSNIVKFQNFLLKCKSPQDVFMESEDNKFFLKNYNSIKKKYNELLREANKQLSDNYLWFEYSGELSISSDLSNELSYIHSGKYIFVIFRKGGLCNLSIRGKGVKKILEKVISKFEFAAGGGHDDAVGSRIRMQDLEDFKNRFIKEIK